MLVALVLFACSPTPEGPPAYAVPTVSGPVPNRVELRPFEVATFTWTFEWPDGVVPSGQSLEGSIDGTLADGSRFTTAWTTPNQVMQVTYAAPRTRGLESFGTTLVTRQAANTSWGVAIQLPVAEVDVRGGPAESIVAWQDEVRLGVGEVRPVHAYPLAEWRSHHDDGVDPNGEPGWSEEPVSYAIEHAAVATVDDDGVITAHATGATTLTFTAGAVSRDVAVVVDDTPLAPPPLAPVPILDSPLAGESNETNDASGLHRARVAVGPDGYPVAAFRTEPGLVVGTESPFFTNREPLILARWTGTAFGYELLGTPTERLTHAGVSVDALGDTYLLTRSLRANNLELWHRAEGVEVGGWTRRELPIGLGPFDGPGDLGTWSTAAHLNAYWPISLMPRPGGGVWLAWLVADDTEQSGRCPIAVRVASATATSLAVELAQVIWTPTGACEPVRRGDIGLAAPPGGGAWPMVLVGDWTLFRSSDAWQQLTGLPEGPSTWDWLPLCTPGCTEDAPALEQPIGWTLDGRLRRGLVADVRVAGERQTWLDTCRVYAPPGDTEADGRTIVNPGGSTVSFDRVLVTADGTRHLHDDHGVAYVMSEDGPATPSGGLTYSASWVYLPWRHGDGLRMVHHRSLTSYEATVWQWDEAWTVETSLPYGGGPVDVGPDPDGGAWILTAYDTTHDVVLLHHIDAEGEVLSVELPIGGSPVLRDGVAALPDGGAALVYNRMGPGAKRTARFSADGTLLDEGSLDAFPHMADLVALSDGTLVMPPWIAQNDPNLYVSTDGVTWTTRAAPPGMWSGLTHLRVADDGDLLWVGTRLNDCSGHQAAIVRSGDVGITWTDPVWVRSHGNGMQQVADVALEGENALVLLLDQGVGKRPADLVDPHGNLFVRAPLPVRDATR